MKEKMTDKEYQQYWDYLQEKHHRKLKSLDVDIDGEYVNLTYKFEPVAIERIRRITGYLTGTVEKWNDGKTAELNDRVTHSGIEQMEDLKR